MGLLAWTTHQRTFLCPSLQSNVRWLSRQTAADAQFPPHPTNNKLAKHEPESSSEGERERGNETTFPDPVGQHSLSETAAANIAGQKMGLSCATASRAAVESGGRGLYRLVVRLVETVNDEGGKKF